MERGNLSERLILWIFALLIFGSFLGSLLKEARMVAWSPIFFSLAWLFLTVLHELGHAWMTRRLGWRLPEVVIGIGPLWRRFSWRETEVEIRRIPISGYIVAIPHPRHLSRLSHALIAAAGPGAELLILGLIWLILGESFLETREELLHIALQSTALAAALGAGFNLLPITFSSGAHSDGKNLLMSPFLSREDFEDKMALRELLQLKTLAEHQAYTELIKLAEEISGRYPSALSPHLVIAQALVELGRREEALFLLRALTLEQRRPTGWRVQAEEALANLRAQR